METKQRKEQYLKLFNDNGWKGGGAGAIIQSKWALIRLSNGRIVRSEYSKFIFLEHRCQGLFAFE